MYSNFSLIFSALGPETEGHIKQAKDKIRFDFQKVVRAFAFRGREKFNSSF